MPGSVVRKVVVVDDDPTILAGYERGFRREGFEVTAASTASAARTLVRRENPELLVVDLRIGADWGIELIRELKAASPEMRIVLVSGYLSVASAVAAMHAGADEVLTKPTTSSRILEILADVQDEQAPPPPPPPTLAEVERDHVLRVLADCYGNISEAARQLGIHRQSLQRYLRRNIATT